MIEHDERQEVIVGHRFQALFFPARAESGTKARYYKKEHPGVRRTSHWMKHELEAIFADDRPSDVILAKKLGRSISAIQSVRSRIQREPPQ